jgi:hypothetical protein
MLLLALSEGSAKELCAPAEDLEFLDITLDDDQRRASSDFSQISPKPNSPRRQRPRSAHTHVTANFAGRYDERSKMLRTMVSSARPILNSPWNSPLSLHIHSRLPTQCQSATSTGVKTPHLHWCVPWQRLFRSSKAYASPKPAPAERKRLYT